MIGSGGPPSVDQCFVHVEYQGYLFLVSFIPDGFGNHEEVFLFGTAIEIVLELGQARSTVVRKRNWRMKLFSHLSSSFSENSLRPTLATASFMNIVDY